MKDGRRTMNEGIKRRPQAWSDPPTRTRPDRFYREACSLRGLRGHRCRLNRDARKPVRSFERGGSGSGENCQVWFSKTRSFLSDTWKTSGVWSDAPTPRTGFTSTELRYCGADCATPRRRPPKGATHTGVSQPPLFRYNRYLFPVHTDVTHRFFCI